jgi:hypothetical protein
MDQGIARVVCEHLHTRCFCILLDGAEGPAGHELKHGGDDLADGEFCDQLQATKGPIGKQEIAADSLGHVNCHSSPD